MELTDDTWMLELEDGSLVSMDLSDIDDWCDLVVHPDHDPKIPEGFSVEVKQYGEYGDGDGIRVVGAWLYEEGRALNGKFPRFYRRSLRRLANSVLDRLDEFSDDGCTPEELDALKAEIFWKDGGK